MGFKKDTRTIRQKLLEAYKQGKIDLDYIYNSVDVIIRPSEYRILLFDIEKYEKRKKRLIGESPLFTNFRKENNK